MKEIEILKKEIEILKNRFLIVDIAIFITNMILVLHIIGIIK